jgi:hypothetical protein
MRMRPNVKAVARGKLGRPHVIEENEGPDCAAGGRPHQTLDYRTPVKVEAQYEQMPN